MSHLSRLGCGPRSAALLALLIAGNAHAQSGTAPDLFVNGQPISTNHVLLMSSGITTGEGARKLNDAESQSAARLELVTQELLAQEARKNGLEKNPVIADQLAFQSRVILSRAFLENYFVQNPVTDASLKAAYEFKRAKGELREYKVRHILVTSSDQAQDIGDRLGRGESFIDLAKRYSQDPGGQSNGGDLGWFRPDTFVDHHFADAVTTLKKGQYTRLPVRSRFGWHVVMLDEAPRPVSNPEPFDALPEAAVEAMRQRTAQVKIEELTARLAATAKVTGPGASAVARSSK